MRSATIKRCSWVSVDDPLMLQYHDREWGVPVHKGPAAAVAGSARITGKPEINRGPRRLFCAGVSSSHAPKPLNPLNRRLTPEFDRSMYIPCLSHFSDASVPHAPPAVSDP